MYETESNRKVESAEADTIGGDFRSQRSAWEDFGPHRSAMERALHGVRLANLLFDLRPLQSEGGWEMPQVCRWHGSSGVPGSFEFLSAQDSI